MEKVGEFFVKSFLSFLGAIARGWTLSLLWVMLIIPLFGLPEFTILQFVVGVFVFNVMTSKYSEFKKAAINKKEGKGELTFTEDITLVIAWIVGSNTLILAIGWIMSLFIG